jgi:long-subunit fatty acid transport protein
MALQTVEGTLAATGQSGFVSGRKVDVLLSGAWVGTVKLQVLSQNVWTDTGTSWTANAFQVSDVGDIFQWRLDFARTSGSLIFDLRGNL